jgi:hypothetical protein
LPEPEHTADVTLGELMNGPLPQDDPTPLTAAVSAKRAIEVEPDPSGAGPMGTTSSDHDDLLEDDDYLLEPPRRFSRLTVVLVVALIFLCGFIVGVLAARLTGGPPRGSAESSIVSTVGSASAAWPI